MSVIGFQQPDSRERQIEGCTIVLGALLRGLHPADALAWVARVLAEAGVPADLNLLGAEGDTERFVQAIGGALPLHDDAAHVGSGCYARVLEGHA